MKSTFVLKFHMSSNLKSMKHPVSWMFHKLMEATVFLILDDSVFYSTKKILGVHSLLGLGS